LSKFVNIGDGETAKDMIARLNGNKPQAMDLTGSTASDEGNKLFLFLWC